MIAQEKEKDTRTSGVKRTRKNGGTKKKYGERTKGRRKRKRENEGGCGEHVHERQRRSDAHTDIIATLGRRSAESRGWGGFSTF